MDLRISPRFFSWGVYGPHHWLQRTEPLPIPLTQAPLPAEFCTARNSNTTQHSTELAFRDTAQSHLTVPQAQETPGQLGHPTAEKTEKEHLSLYHINHEQQVPSTATSGLT